MALHFQMLPHVHRRSSLSPEDVPTPHQRPSPPPSTGGTNFSTPTEGGRQVEWPGLTWDVNTAANRNELPRRPSLTSSDIPDTHERPSPSPPPLDGRADFSTPTEEGRQVEFPGLTAEEEAAGDDERPQKSEDQSISDGRPPSPLHEILRVLAVLALLANAAIWGTLTRDGLVALNTYEGRSIQPVIWAQALGCLVMGWTVANKEALEAFYPPLFIALSTGYCGSVTTFSTWILQVFQAYSNQRHYARHGLHNVLDALTQTAATLGMSLAALFAGKSLAGVLPADPMLRRVSKGRRSSTRLTPKIDALVFLTLGVGCWAGAALLAGLATRQKLRPTTFAVTFAPLGTILRWLLSPLNSNRLSKRAPYWPLGTFIANISATSVIAGLFVAQHYGQYHQFAATRTVTSCHILYGLQEGFCGGLSTVSTFAVELRNLKPHRRAVGYAFGSYAVGIAICVVVIGTPWWSGGGMDGSCTGLIGYPQ